MMRERTARTPRLYPELLAYCFAPVLYENTMDKQDQVDLGCLQLGCLDAWSSIESAVQHQPTRSSIGACATGVVGTFCAMSRQQRFRVVPMPMTYSYRKASMGLIAAARRAGT